MFRAPRIVCVSLKIAGFSSRGQRSIAAIGALYAGAQCIGDLGLTAAAGLPEPIEHVFVDPHVNVAFSLRDTFDGPRPVRGFVDIVRIPGNARFEFLLRRNFDGSPVRSTLAARQLPLDLLRGITGGIVSFLHRTLPSTS
jgi:hypothetical protein